MEFTDEKLSEYPEYQEATFYTMARTSENVEKIEDAIYFYQKGINFPDLDIDDYKDYSLRLAKLYLLTESYKDAIDLYLTLKNIAKDNEGENSFEYINSLNNLSIAYETSLDYQNAILYLDTALDITKRNWGENDDNYITMLRNQAQQYRKNNQFDKAINQFNKVLEIIKENKNEVSELYYSTVNLLGITYSDLGKNDRAIDFYLKAIKQTEKNIGKNNKKYVDYVSNLAGVYSDLGLHYKKLPLLLEVKDIVLENWGKQDEQYIKNLIDLARAYENIIEYDTAINYYEEAMNYYEKNLSKKSTMRYGVLLNDLAILYSRIDEYEKGLPLALEALNIAKNNFKEDTILYCIRLNTLALLYSGLRRYDKSFPLYLEVMKTKSVYLGEYHPNMINSYNNMANAYLHNNELDKMLPLYEKSFEVLKNKIKKELHFLSEEEKEFFLSSLYSNFTLYKNFIYKFGTQYPTSGELVYNIELYNKGLILSASQNMIDQLEKSMDNDILNVYYTWKTKNMMLAKLFVTPLAERTLDSETLIDEVEALEKQLLVYINQDENFDIETIQWEGIRNKLKENEIAIEFSSFYQLDYDSNKWVNNYLYMASILRKNDTIPQIVPLFTQKQLDKIFSTSETSHAQIANLYRGAVAKSTQQYDFAKLYNLIWQPMEKYLDEGKTIYFAPSGTLNQIAFSAITTPDGEYLSDKYDLRQVSTTAKLLEETSTEKFTDITLFGGINYDEDSKTIAQSVQNIQGKDAFVSRSLTEDLNRGGETWSYLQGTLTEVERIQTVAQKGQAKVNYYTGNQATEEQFKALNGKNSPQILHIATHGFFFPDPEITKEDLERMQLRDEQQNMFKLSNHPLNRSGLLFAGANHTWKGEAATANIEDGILTAYEASNVALPNTKLVVLSACETGLGDIQGSEGVYGLQRSFKMAGAKYLLMSLWQVPDKETAEFMEYFYSKLFASNDIEASYKATQEYMKEKYANEPYKWAAFVLVR